jgi:hypothetical protein
MSIFSCLCDPSPAASFTFTTPPTRTDILAHSGGRVNIAEASDGNCLFRAIARQTLGDATLHARVRAELYAHMAKHRSDFEAWEPDFDKYLAQQRNSGTWGGELELKAAAVVYQRSVYAYQPQANEAVTRLTVHRAQGEGVLYSPLAKVPSPTAQDICVWYEGGSHWNSLVAPGAANSQHTGL